MKSKPLTVASKPFHPGTSEGGGNHVATPPLPLLHSWAFSWPFPGLFLPFLGPAGEQKLPSALPHLQGLRRVDQGSGTAGWQSPPHRTAGAFPFPSQGVLLHLTVIKISPGGGTTCQRIRDSSPGIFKLFLFFHLLYPVNS